MAPPQYTPICTFTQLTHPPPFHPDQLQHAQSGCPDCLDHLVQENERLVHWVLHNFRSVSLPYDEALQAGRVQDDGVVFEAGFLLVTRRGPRRLRRRPLAIRHRSRPGPCGVQRVGYRPSPDGGRRLADGR